MKNFRMFLLQFTLLTSVVLAQAESPFTEHKLEEFDVRNEETVSINGQEFVKLDVEMRNPSDFNSFSSADFSNKNVNFSRGLLAANVTVDMLAGYGVYSMKYDKAKHFLAGYVIGNVATGAFQLILPRTMKHRKVYAALGGFGASVFVGIGKEVWDAQGHGDPDAKDAMATALGGLTGTITMSFDDISNAFKKKKKP